MAISGLRPISGRRARPTVAMRRAARIQAPYDASRAKRSARARSTVPASTPGAGWAATERPGHHPAYRRDYTYTKISITLTQSWYGTTKGSYPAYGHGAHHTTAHIHLAVNDPTTNLVRY